MKINEVICIHELKKLELIHEEKQQLNEVLPLLAAVPWLIGAGMTAYDYYQLSKKEGTADPSEWSGASQAEIVASTAGTVAGGFLGRALGKGLGWAAGKGLRAAGGTISGASSAVKQTAKRAAAAALKKGTKSGTGGLRRDAAASLERGARGGIGGVKSVGAVTGAKLGTKELMKKGPGIRAFRGGKAPFTQRIGGAVVGTAGVAGGRIAGRELEKSTGALKAINPFGKGDAMGRDADAPKPAAKKKAAPAKKPGGYYAANPELL